MLRGGGQGEVEIRERGGRITWLARGGVGWVWESEGWDGGRVSVRYEGMRVNRG